MSDDPKIVEFLKPDVPPEEMVRRQRVEAERLARLSPGEWQLWIDRRAAQLGMPRAPLEASVRAIIAQLEKDKRERKADEERARREAEKAATRKRRERAKSTEREFRVLAELPEREQEARLDSLAKRLGEDPAGLREEFVLSTSPPASEKPELWPDAVETAALLEELTLQLRRFVVFRHDSDAIVVALWIMFAWIHAVAVHSPNLAITSPEPFSGKSTLLGVLARVTPRPFTAVELTGPSLYRRVDRDRPTMLIDEADDLFQRKPDLRHIINAGWTRGTKIPRTVQGVDRDFDPFCPKAIALKGSNMPDTTASRNITLSLWPKLPDETVEAFLYADAPEFLELRRKLARWSADQATTLAEAKPEFPSGFNNRLAANWRLLLAVADHSGEDWPKQARSAAVRLSHTPFEPSEGRQLIWMFEEMLADREFISSDDVVRMLNADPIGIWCNFRGRGPISQWQVAALLRPFEVYPQIHHPTKRANKTARGYLTSQFVELFARFPRPNPYTRTS